jgi:hypothetical protein
LTGLAISWSHECVRNHSPRPTSSGTHKLYFQNSCAFYNRGSRTDARNIGNIHLLMPNYTAIVTLLAIAFYFFLATRVAQARGKFGIRHPATTGNPDFERIFRAHTNMLEWMTTFLVPLWLCALYFSDVAAAVVGLIWIGG